MLHDLTLPLTPGGPNVNCYYADEVTDTTIEAGSFIGSVAQGGSVNYRRLGLTPHGNGTHTECYGHISDNPTATLYNCHHDFVLEALLVSVPLTTLPNQDLVFTLASLQQAIVEVGGIAAMPKALIVRTLPNLDSKCQAQYSGKNPPYPEPGIGSWLASQGVMHWLVDLPSVDRERDNGVLANHKGFWQVSDRGSNGYRNQAAQAREQATITELTYIPDHVKDGRYRLYLMPMALHSDAAPSRILIEG